MNTRSAIVITAFLMSIGIVVSAQNVNIPDANFKEYLLGNALINTNSDDEIQVSEASAFSGEIDCSDMDIADLTGIEAFTALTVLYCVGNDLTSLNVSANTVLIELYCIGNDLSSLDVSANTALTQLYCADNQLTALDVNSNILLDRLVCAFNELTSIDVSGNTALTGLSCASNQLVSLNAQNGNNINFIALSTTNNPNLTCIQVDDATYSNTHWTDEFYFGKDEQTSYSENCGTINILEETVSNEIRVYPNPANSALNINTESPLPISMVDVLGNVVLQTKLNTGNNTIDVGSLSSGIYFIQSNNNATAKFVKE